MQEAETTFTLTPMSHKLRLEPGETYEGSIKIINPMSSKEAFSYKASVTPYGVMDSDYSIDFATRTEQSRIVDWITIDEPLGMVEPNEIKELHFTIKVPEDAAGGGQYAAISIVSDIRDTSNGGGLDITNIYEMVSVIYAQINGEIKREGEVKANDIVGFITQPPITLKSTIVNNGNIHESAEYNITVKNFFNGTQIYPEGAKETIQEEVIMPGTERNITKEIVEVPALGLYEVTQSIKYMGQTSYASSLVVACPVWFMAMVGVVMAVIGVGIWRAIVHHRRRKNAIM